MTAQSDIQSNLPLREATCFILLSLAPKPRHGYAIMKDVRSLSRDRVQLRTGTLYGALKRLLEQGWIQRYEDPEPNHTQRKRNLYRLTGLGRLVLEAEVTRLNSLVSAARERCIEAKTSSTQAPA